MTGRHVHKEREKEGPMQGAQTDGVHAASNGKPCAGPDRPLRLRKKDGVRRQAS
jgi:hypothetical protein